MNVYYDYRPITFKINENGHYDQSYRFKLGDGCGSGSRPGAVHLRAFSTRSFRLNTASREWLSRPKRKRKNRAAIIVPWDGNSRFLTGFTARTALFRLLLRIKPASLRAIWSFSGKRSKIYSNTIVLRLAG